MMSWRRKTWITSAFLLAMATALFAAGDEEQLTFGLLPSRAEDAGVHAFSLSIINGQHPAKSTQVAGDFRAWYNLKDQALTVRFIRFQASSTVCAIPEAPKTVYTTDLHTSLSGDYTVLNQKNLPEGDVGLLLDECLKALTTLFRVRLPGEFDPAPGVSWGAAHNEDDPRQMDGGAPNTYFEVASAVKNAGGSTIAEIHSSRIDTLQQKNEYIYSSRSIRLRYDTKAGLLGALVAEHKHVVQQDVLGHLDNVTLSIELVSDPYSRKRDQ